MALVLLAGESQSSEVRRLVHTTPCLTILEHTMPRSEPGLLVLCSNMIAGYIVRLCTFGADVPVSRDPTSFKTRRLYTR